MVASRFATDNPTALKVNGDREVFALRTTKVVGDNDFGDQLVKSLERFNDAPATLQKLVKFAVRITEGSDYFRGVVNSPKERQKPLLRSQRPLTYLVGCANLFSGLHFTHLSALNFCPAGVPPALPRCHLYYDTARNKKQHSDTTNSSKPSKITPKCCQTGSIPTIDTATNSA